MLEEVHSIYSSCQMTCLSFKQRLFITVNISGETDTELLLFKTFLKHLTFFHIIFIETHHMAFLKNKNTMLL